MEGRVRVCVLGGGSGMCVGEGRVGDVCGVEEGRVGDALYEACRRYKNEHR